jgi:hypothetical protein
LNIRNCEVHLKGPDQRFKIHLHPPATLVDFPHGVRVTLLRSSVVPCTPETPSWPPCPFFIFHLCPILCWAGKRATSTRKNWWEPRRARSICYHVAQHRNPKCRVHWHDQRDTQSLTLGELFLLFDNDAAVLHLCVATFPG